MGISKNLNIAKPVIYIDHQEQAIVMIVIIVWRDLIITVLGLEPALEREITRKLDFLE